jgi:excisionase family DNA binding protein
MDELLSLTQSAAICGVHIITLQRAINRGELKSLKIGRRRLVDRTELYKWIEKQSQSSK